MKETNLNKMIAYKIFNENLQCRGQQYEIGRTYWKYNGLTETYSAFSMLESNFLNELKTVKLKLCSNHGFHFCEKLKDCYNYKEFNNKNPRFCEVEVLGAVTSDYDKGVTNCLKIVRELSKEELEKIKAEYERKMQKQILERNLYLPQIRQLQTKYPHFIVGGSAALYLHGVRLKRWEHQYSKDVDIITPFYTLIQDDKNISCVVAEKKYSSGSDFDENVTVNFFDNTFKIDIKISPKEKYKLIALDGFTYKVSLLEKTIKAKAKYALDGNEKHKQDLMEMCTGNVK